MARHVRLAEAKPAQSPAGSLESAGTSEAPAGSAAPLDLLPPGRSESEAWRAVILAKLAAGLSAQRIYQDLVSEHGFGHTVMLQTRRIAGLRVLQGLPTVT